MDPVLSKAILVLVVGMITVFVILFLVILTGTTIIRLVNRFFPGEEKLASPRLKPAPVFEDFHNNSGNKIAAIIAAVESITKGEGKISRIDRIK